MEPIKNDNDLVGVLDELKHQIKEGVRVGPMCCAFNDVLNEFIQQWHLDGDPHAFAEWPQRIAMKCTSCGHVEEMKRIEQGSDGTKSALPLYLCPCGCQHEFEGNFEEFESDSPQGGRVEGREA